MGAAREGFPPLVTLHPGDKVPQHIPGRQSSRAQVTAARPANSDLRLADDRASSAMSRLQNLNVFLLRFYPFCFHATAWYSHLQAPPLPLQPLMAATFLVSPPAFLPAPPAPGWPGLGPLLPPPAARPAHHLPATLPTLTGLPLWLRPHKTPGCEGAPSRLGSQHPCCLCAPPESHLLQEFALTSLPPPFCPAH